MHFAKIFKTGHSQAVRLPKDFRLSGKKVAISHLGRGIVLQPINETWNDIYNSMEKLSDDDFDLMINIEDLPPQERDKM